MYLTKNARGQNLQYMNTDINTVLKQLHIVHK